MKNTLKITFILIVVLSFGCKEQQKDTTLASFNDSLSYSYGVQIAESIKSLNDSTVDIEMVAAALAEAYNGDAKLTMQECQQIMMAQNTKAGEAALAEGQAYLDVNKSKEGFNETESGLQYRVITEGSGKSPEATDEVTVHYTGKLIDGTVFDSSVERGEPVEFPVNGVIPGWTEALKLMKEGSKWELVIPSELAYGPRGSRGAIPPNAVLIFEVELISVN